VNKKQEGHAIRPSLVYRPPHKLGLARNFQSRSGKLTSRLRSDHAIRKLTRGVVRWPRRRGPAEAAYTPGRPIFEILAEARCHKPNVRFAADNPEPFTCLRPTSNQEG